MAANGMARSTVMGQSKYLLIVLLSYNLDYLHTMYEYIQCHRQKSYAMDPPPTKAGEIGDRHVLPTLISGQQKPGPGTEVIFQRRGECNHFCQGTY